MSETPHISATDEPGTNDRAEETAIIPVEIANGGEVRLREFSGVEVDEIADEANKGASY